MDLIRRLLCCAEDAWVTSFVTIQSEVQLTGPSSGTSRSGRLQKVQSQKQSQQPPALPVKPGLLVLANKGDSSSPKCPSPRCLRLCCSQATARRIVESQRVQMRLGDDFNDICQASPHDSLSHPNPTCGQEHDRYVELTMCSQNIRTKSNLQHFDEKENVPQVQSGFQRPPQQDLMHGFEQDLAHDFKHDLAHKLEQDLVHTLKHDKVAETRPDRSVNPFSPFPLPLDFRYTPRPTSNLKPKTVSYQPTNASANSMARSKSKSKSKSNSKPKPKSIPSVMETYKPKPCGCPTSRVESRRDQSLLKQHLKSILRQSHLPQNKGQLNSPFTTDRPKLGFSAEKHADGPTSFNHTNPNTRMPNRSLRSARGRNTLGFSRLLTVTRERKEEMQQAKGKKEQQEKPACRSSFERSKKTTTAGLVAPSLHSAFCYAPSYFKPDILKHYKLDADLATALARAGACRQLGHTVRNLLTGSDLTDTTNSVSTGFSTAAPTARLLKNDAYPGVNSNI